MLSKFTQPARGGARILHGQELWPIPLLVSVPSSRPGTKWDLTNSNQIRLTSLES